MIEEVGNLEGRIVSNLPLTGNLTKAIEYVEPTTQEKTATPTSQEQIILPDEGVFALSKVVVNPIPSEYIIPSGTLNISDNGNYDVRNKEYANVNIPNMWTNVGYSDTPQAIMNMYNHAKEIYDAYDTSWTSLRDKYRSDKSLYVFPLVDTSNVTTMSGAFYSCSNLTEIPLLNTSKCEGLATTFYGCTNLKNVPILDTSKNNNWTNTFNNCPNLTDDSLNNILKMCIDTPITYSTTAKTLYALGFRSSNYPASRIQALSNYTAFTTAGWSIGY